MPVVKHRNIDSKSASSGSCGIDAAKRDELHHDSSESVSSSLKETLLSTGESSLNQNNGDQNISTDCNIEKFVGVNSSDKDRNNENDHLESPDCDIKTAEVSNEFCSSTAHA